MERIELPFGGNRNCPLYVETSEAIGREIGGIKDKHGEPAGSLVIRDTNGAPLFRLGLDHVGATIMEPVPVTEYGIVLTLFSPVTIRPMTVPR